MYLKYLLFMIILVLVMYRIVRCERNTYERFISLNNLPGVKELTDVRDEVKNLNNEYLDKIRNIENILKQIQDTNNTLLEKQVDVQYKSLGESILTDDPMISMESFKVRLCGEKEEDRVISSSPLAHESGDSSMLLDQYIKYKDEYDKDNSRACSLKKKEEIEKVIGKLKKLLDQMDTALYPCP